MSATDYINDIGSRAKAASRELAALQPEAKADLIATMARHVDAGYEVAVETARAEGLKIPMMEE